MTRRRTRWTSAATAAVILAVMACLIAPSATAAPAPSSAARDLVVAVRDRLALAVPVAAAKRASGAAVDDPVREQQAADAFVALLDGHGIPAADARAFITAQFEASKSVQRALLDQWLRRPATAPPGPPPSLVAQVRPAIDQATEALAVAYAAAWEQGRRHPRAWSRSLAAAEADERGRWAWQRRSMELALDPLTLPADPRG